MKRKLLFLTSALLPAIYLCGQGIGFFGNTTIHEGGTLNVKDYAVGFQGKVETAVAEPYGILSLNNTTVAGAGDTAHVDGWIESTHPGIFEFPLGNENTFAPLIVNAPNVLTANYQKTAPPNAESLSAGLTAISAVEYWNLSGDEQGTLTLTWRESSNIEALTGGSLNFLRIAGWNDTASLWEPVPHTAYTGTLETGSIESEAGVNFAAYSAFTFAYACNLVVEVEETPEICAANTIQLTAVSNGGVVYWYDSEEAEEHIATGEVFETPVLNETTTYWVEVEEGSCFSDRTEVLVTVNPSPEFTLEDPEPEVCYGTPANLYAFSAGNVIFWYDSAEATEYLYHGNLFLTESLTETTTFWVEAYNLETGCSSERTEIVVTVNPVPEAPEAVTVQYFTEGQTLADLEVNYTGTITWYADENLTVVLPSSTPLVAFTTYYVTQTIGGCESEATAITVEPELNVTDNNEVEFSYYPNPVKDRLTIKGSENIASVSVYDLSGKLVKTERFANKEVVINLAGLSTAAYIVEVRTENTVKLIKIIKK